ncbi:serine/threonine-protein kinase [Streptomyces katrae]|uniref:non-specific serine/threonine protein kinase n=1 Tax=Streptomyces katrae TaxID=68223 RepID=A0ABT7GYH0_9ACTN|nr:serine/threonine-protein kinase [Streptomyces katrae]MDK9497929.1 serine/threonine-protein kinase [Streptomyces katrae]
MADEAQQGQLVNDRYRLVRALGSGGMGRVWKAHDVQLDTHVAVKELLLPSGFSAPDRADLLERALREARSAARLRAHPNVVTVHDVTLVGGVPWIVMELVSGSTLQERLRVEHRLPVEEVAEVASALLRALGAAHAEGIVHRDVKPANVMLTEDGRILLADFGIALNEADDGLTGTGVVIGSMPYLSPERARGEKGGAPSDLFSLGTTLYEAVEGVSPFKRETKVGSQYAVAHASVPPPRHAGRLEPLIKGLMERDPDARLTVAGALELLAPAKPAPPPPVSPPPAFSPPAFPPPAPEPPEPEPRPASAPGIRAAAAAPSESRPSTTRPAPARAASAGARIRAGGRTRRVPAPPTRRPLRGLALFAAGAVLIAGGSYAAYQWTRTQYFVGVNDGHVAVFRGINQELGGTPLWEVETDHPEIELRYLPVYQRKQVEATITADGPDDARARAAQLALQASACAKNAGENGEDSVLTEEERLLTDRCGN